MSPKTLTWILLFAAVLTGSFRLRFLGAKSDELALEQATYETVRELINERYVRELNADDQQKMFYGALKGMTSSLDAHSQFLPPESYDHLSASTRGRFAGIGIEIVEEPRKHTIKTPLLDSPAWRAGIQQGDRIVKIDGKDTEELSSEQCEMLIKGPPDTVLSLTIERDRPKKDPERIELTMRRALIKVNSIQATELLGPKYVPADEPKLGYIQLSQFQQDTSDDLDAALKKLEAQGMTALILDLRMNGGGLLDQATRVCDLFLKDGLIVTLQHRDAVSSKNAALGEQIHVVPGKTHPDYPLAILVDSQSASAAEIVSGALHDRGRAILVGDRTYGKFSVQDVIPLDLGRRDATAVAGGSAPGIQMRQEKIGALKLTIAKYKTPKSDCIDGQGLVPDYLIPSTPEQQNALSTSRYKRHLRENDPQARNGGAPKPEYEDNFDDVQLKKAVQVLREHLSGEKK
ncbi:MAG TPA: S41 family peptidase [Planctomycetota bacterium]|nr:S41 family peptidase [Planctomycetota bacterium]